MVEPKIGDKVIITKSKENWSSEMEQYVGKIFTLANFDSFGQAIFIEFAGNWNWFFTDGHYKLYNEINTYELW